MKRFARVMSVAVALNLVVMSTGIARPASPTQATNGLIVPAATIAYAEDKKADTKVEAKPAETKKTETKADSKPSEAKPAEVKKTDTKADSKPAEVQKTDAKVEAKADPKPAERSRYSRPSSSQTRIPLARTKTRPYPNIPSRRMNAGLTCRANFSTACFMTSL